ncbi:MAG TPA: tRNA epoxyqueuosine(34) reductase QueG [Thermoanaerobaculia bacterium]
MSAPPDRLRLAEAFRREAARQGFARCGIAAAGEPPRFGRFRSWLAAGRHAGMAYLATTAGVRADPGRLLPGVRSVICLSFAHEAGETVAADGARLARYASGPDYHGHMRRRAEAVAAAVRDCLGAEFRWRVCVDSTPLSERAFAAAAGLGWIGKNGCLIDPERGSFLLLAEILVDVELPPDDPMGEQCGSCSLCLHACPTQAFPEPGVLDASRCLSYWSIEHRGALPDAVKPQMSEWLFGCDICQEVCPYNAPVLAASPAAAEPPTRAGWLEMGKGAWKARYGASALNRQGRRGLQRNAAASAGASNARELLPALQDAAACPDRGLSDAAAWAVGRLG